MRKSIDETSNQHTCLAIISRGLTAVVRMFSRRIILNRFLCAQSVLRRGSVAATYPWDIHPQHFHVCADFVPATCSRYTSLLNVASRFTKQVFVAATCHCDMCLQHDSSCLPALIVARESHFKKPFASTPVTSFRDLRRPKKS